MINIIKKIEINSFRSIYREKIDTDSVNIFSGINDVGKSNILNGINLFFNSQTDFGMRYDFSFDYSKVSLAAAQRSNKKKQQIKIKIFFNVPSTFKSLSDEEEIWVERSYDRYGKMIETLSTEDRKKKASITRFINTIQYFYIPALKGPDVMRYILGEVGRRKLVSDNDIRELNHQINDNIIDLKSILADSVINNETKFELPVLVEDFWQKLNINTKYDEFNELEEKINPSKKGEKNSLKSEYYQVPLQLRGDGIKSKFIPPLLQWIQKHDSNKHYVWGIDEPENSLEFKKSQELADLYFTKYGKDAQLFLTSHSLAFIFPSLDRDITVFKCIKGEFGATQIKPLKSLFKEQEKYKIAEEIGVLEIQKEMYEEWHEKDKQINTMKKQLQNIARPIIFLEGEIDEKYFKKTIEAYDIKDYPSDIKMIGYRDENGNDSFSGKDALKWVTKFHKANPDLINKKIILFFDIDCKIKTSIDKNLITYCPKNNPTPVYDTGIEHLIVFPEDFNKEKFMHETKNGDKRIFIPDKNKIFEYVQSLQDESLKKSLVNIYNTLISIKEEYLSDI